jgi:hypothetical protein
MLIKKSMVIVSLSGGLGNQMFQFSSAYALAKRNNALLTIDISQFDKSDRSHAVYMLDNFSLKNNTVKFATNISWKIALKLGLIFKVPYIISFKLKKIFKVIIEDSISYSEDIDTLSSGNVFITNSQLQSYKYFHSMKNDIVNLFKINDKLEKYRLKEKTRVLSMHIRRGDYLHSDCAMSLLSEEYFINAYKYVVSNFEAIDCIYLFTDDIVWVKKNMSNLFKICCQILIIEEEFKNISAVESLSIMSNCELSIISNSSFSWWGAYLGKEKEVVIAPSKWFVDNRIHDIIPENWITLPG